ncbi:hypothetical protein SCLCIDRAFT_1212854, partial [Scleroderma citrinum Foug A]
MLMSDTLLVRARPDSGILLHRVPKQGIQADEVPEMIREGEVVPYQYFACILCMKLLLVSQRRTHGYATSPTRHRRLLTMFNSLMRVRARRAPMCHEVVPELKLDPI